MLQPDTRSVYTAAFTPPPGYVFDQAVATTFSLDLVTMLSIPVHFTLLNQSSSHRMDPISLFEGLRRSSRKISVYVQKTQIKIPDAGNTLCSMLEEMLVEVRSPRGGSFHPKLWLVRFNGEDGEEKPLLRLLILSRNLTADRSWDLSLQLEGLPSGRYIAANREVGELIRDLPRFAENEVSTLHVDRAAFLADEVRRTSWVPPNGFESVSFHVLGKVRRKWTPPESEEMLVISPFIQEDALRHLRSTTRNLRAVLSRPEELETLTCEDGMDSLSREWLVFDEAAEVEDGEEVESHDDSGLHAKAYALHCGRRFHIFVGSANATDAALLHSINIEVLAELVCQKSGLASIDSIVGQDGLGPVLKDYAHPEEKPETDPQDEEAERVLDAAKERIGKAGLKVICEREEDSWQLVLKASAPIEVNGIESFRAWPISLPRDRSVDAIGLASGSRVVFGKMATSSVTGLIAFELSAEVKPKMVRFVLNVPVEGLPPDRDDAILQSVLENREGFLRYLLLLLGGFEDGLQIDEYPQAGERFGAGWLAGARGHQSFLEELTRTFIRDPQRLEEIDDVVKRLQKRDGNILPGEFLSLWEIFTQAMGKAGSEKDSH